MKKICSLFLMAMLVFLAVPVQTKAIDLKGEIVSSSPLRSGVDGNISWSVESVIYDNQLDKSCGYWTLMVKGKGDMPDYAPEYCSAYNWTPVAQWSKWKDDLAEDSYYIFVYEGVTSIGDYAFNSFGNVMYITLPEGVTTIGEAAFAGCCNLREITIPKSVTSIGEGAFVTTNSYKVIRCYSDSYAHKYAEENGIAYYLLDKTECENNGHTSYGSTTCTEALTCSVCDEVMEQATGHDYAEATCESPQRCRDCGVTTGEALGHNWSSWAAYGFGYQYRTCSMCGDMETRIASVSQKVTSINITGKSTTLLTGKKMTLTASVSPSNAENKEVTWKSSNKKYATVTAKGVVKAKAAGAGKTVTITATAKDGSGEKDTYQITIKGAVKKIKLKASQKTVKAGKKLTVKAIVTVGAGGSKELKWTSSNKKYAAVNANGVVTTKKAGKGKTVKITAKAKDGSGKKATIKIKIK